jgi:photosystem II stability/assembly factor-like uncharacterized protein
MKRKLILVLIVFTLPAYAQQHGWVRVAQLGNQFTSLAAVEFVDSLHGWTAQGTSAFYRTTDGGNTWTAYDAAAGFSVSTITMVDTAVGWAVGNASNAFGTIIRTTDGGRNWTLQRRDNSSRVYVGSSSISFYKNTTSGYARNFPDTGKIVQTTDGGNSWTERTIADSIGRFGKLQFVDSLHGWLNSSVGVLRTTDGGSQWRSEPHAVIFNQIFFLDTRRGWGINSGSQRTLYRTTDGAATWTFVSIVPDLSVQALSFTDTMNGWAFGFMFYQGDLAGAIYRTTNGGTSWYREHVGQTRAIRDGLMLDRYHGWAVGDQGAVFAYRPSTSVSEKLDRVPTGYTLRQNYPNPFNPSTSIEYEITERVHVKLTAYDMNGKEVRVLIDHEQEAGVYRTSFDASGLASGAYYCTLKAGTRTSTIKMNHVK